MIKAKIMGNRKKIETHNFDDIKQFLLVLSWDITGDIYRYESGYAERVHGIYSRLVDELFGAVIRESQDLSEEENQWIERLRFLNGELETTKKGWKEVKTKPKHERSGFVTQTAFRYAEAFQSLVEDYAKKQGYQPPLEYLNFKSSQICKTHYTIVERDGKTYRVPVKVPIGLVEDD